VIGDGWDLLVIRDLARGVDRFDALAASLHISRKVLTERLNGLVDHQVVTREPYQERPVRYRYLLTERGRALLPVLVALQDWGDRWLLGDGAVTGADPADGPSAHRLHALVGTAIPELLLPATTGGLRDVVSGTTVLFGYPATGRPSPLPEGWGDIPGAHGCTLENRLFRERHAEFVAAGISVHGVSTQRPDEQRGFAALESIPHVLLSDTGRRLTAALRLPTFRAGDLERLKRFVLVAGPDRVVQAVRYPVTDLPAAVTWALESAAPVASR
jgi:DNA-binding HxlR family transcriptional regulator/peroxiredoxin